MAYQSAYSASEQQVERYIAACGENGAATVADVMLDQWFGHLDARVKNQLRADLITVLTRNLSELETAQAASVSVQGPDLISWLEDQEGI